MLIIIIISTTLQNESTAGADTSVEALKLYDMKLLDLAYNEKVGIVAKRDAESIN